MCKLETPLIVIPGAQKSGTSLLFELLTRSSQVAEPARKEPHFFALEREVVEEHADWYRQLFEEGSGADYWIDASTFYLFFSRSAKRLSEMVEDVRVVLSIRDPVERAFSSYLHMHKKVPAVERRSFAEIVESLEERVDAGESLAEAEDAVVARAAALDTVDAEYLDRDFLRRVYGVEFDSEFPDPLYVYKYFRQSQYHRDWRVFRERFPDRVEVVLFERLVDEPEDVLGRVADFLDLDASQFPRELPHVNRTRVPRGLVARSAIQLRSQFSGLLEPVLETLERTGVREFVSDRLLRSAKPELSDELYGRARHLLEDEFGYWSEKIDAVAHYW